VTTSVSRPFLLIASYSDSIISFRGPLIAALVSRNVTVHMAAPDLNANTSVCRILSSMGVVTHDIPLQRSGTSARSDLWLFWSLFALMRRIRPGVVLGYTIKPVVYGLLAAWIARVPRRFALITGLGYAFTSGRSGPLTRLIQKLYGFALRRARKVFFQNSDDEALFREHRILVESTPSAVVNGSGIDLDAYGAQPLPNVPARFLMIGRLLGDKGVREYVLAAQRMRTLHPDARFGLVGWIDDNPDAISKTELDSWVEKGSIDFLGRLDDVRPAIAAASVYVLPSYREGTPRTVLEAMSMGRAIITTDAPGCRETVIDGENGFLVRTHSVDDLVSAMHKFIDDPALATTMGQRSREIAEEKYDVHKINAVMLREMGIT